MIRFQRTFVLSSFVVLLLPTFSQAQTAFSRLYATAASAYVELSTMTVNDRKIAFREMPAPMQDAIWIAHLKRLLMERTDLTNSERSVILEGIGLLETGVASISRDDPAWAVKVY